MIDYSSHVKNALEATVFHSPTTFSWNGQSSPRIPSSVKRHLSARSARDFLLYHLRSRLYVDFYLRGGAPPSLSIWTDDFGDTRRIQFGSELSAANSGGGCWEGAWHVISASPTEVIVRRGGLAIWVRPEDCRAPAGGTVCQGSQVALRLPKEMLGVSPGYYMCLGDSGADSAQSEASVRIYWNLTSAGAEPFVRKVTRTLNGAQLPFKMKVLTDPTRFDRCDSAVVYLPKNTFKEAAGFLDEVRREISHHLKPETPVFTKRLAPGIGLAEDPARSESFGQHRCRLLADGMVRAHEQRARSLEQRWRVVNECFESHGHSLTTPYLNPGSFDIYDRYSQ